MINDFNVSREVITSLKEYQNLIFKWNNSMNLTSDSNDEKFWNRHILDSLQLMKFINNEIHLVDIGSGSGLPGIVLSICGVKQVNLIESKSKKAAFLLQASKLSSNKINIFNDRVENINITCDILTCRAFASLESIFSLTKNINVTNKYLILKGENYLMDIEIAKKNWIFEYCFYENITNPNGKVIELFNLKRKNG